MEMDSLTITQAAKILGIHPTTLRRKCRAGLVPCIKLPGEQRTTWRISRDTLVAMVKEGLPHE